MLLFGGIWNEGACFFAERATECDQVMIRRFQRSIGDLSRAVSVRCRRPIDIITICEGVVAMMR